MESRIKKDWIGIIGFALAIFTFIFGDGIYNQITGKSIFSVFASAAEVTPTLFNTQNLPTEQTQTPILNETPVYFDTEMILIPKGEFTMGNSVSNSFAKCQSEHPYCEKNWFFDEEPQHTVYLDSFYIDKYEVTNSHYQECVEAGVCSTPIFQSSTTHGSYYGNPSFANYPVIHVDWQQASDYCEWRGASLPTEAQWEKAARGTSHKNYPWGEGIDCGKANYQESQSKGCVGDVSKAGSYSDGVSQYGVYDMSGNVWEWVADWYSENYYQNSPYSNPLGPSSGEYRVLRGGSWNHYWSNNRTTERYYDYPYDTTGKGFPTYGFRCAIVTNP